MNCPFCDSFLDKEMNDNYLDPIPNTTWYYSLYCRECRSSIYKEILSCFRQTFTKENQLINTSFICGKFHVFVGHKKNITVIRAITDGDLSGSTWKDVLLINQAIQVTKEALLTFHKRLPLLLTFS